MTLSLITCLYGSAQIDGLIGLNNGYPTGIRTNEDSTGMVFYGDFAKAGGDFAGGIAMWNSGMWDVSPFAGGSGDTSLWNTVGVGSMAIRNDTVLVGILKNNIRVWQNDSAFGHSAYLANGQWHTCGSPTFDEEFILLEANGRIFGFTKGDTLYGQFSPGIKEWRGGAFQNVKGQANIDPAFVPNSLTYWNNQYYFIGKNNTGGNGDRALWAFDGDSTWTGQVANDVWKYFVRTKCAGYGDSLYYVAYPPILIGGTQAGYQSRIWNGTDWQPFFDVFPHSLPLDVLSYEGILYIAGRFSFSHNGPHYRLLSFDGQTLCALGGTMLGGPLDVPPLEYLAASGPDLYAADQGYIKAFHIPDVNSIIPDTCFNVSVGVDEIKQQNEIIVYPNPSSDMFNFYGAGFKELIIIDAAGRLVDQIQSESRSQATWDASGFSEGIYLVRANLDDGIVAYTRVIKN